MQPAPNPMPAPTTPASQMKTSRVSFADPLEGLTSSWKLGPAAGGSNITKPSDEHKVDDLASPFLSNRPLRTMRSKPIPMPLPPLKSPLKQSEAANLASQRPPTKRTTTDASAGSSRKQPEKIGAVSQTIPPKRSITEAIADGSSSPSSSTPAKRPRLEEMTQKKARLQAEIQAKRDRRAAEEKKLEEGKRQHEAQQRLLLEREAIRREEEEKIKAAEEEERREEEALAAEMEALERENEAEDEEMARVAKEREMLDEMMNEREQSEMDDA